MRECALLAQYQPLPHAARLVAAVDARDKGRHGFIRGPRLLLVVRALALPALPTLELVCRDLFRSRLQRKGRQATAWVAQRVTCRAECAEAAPARLAPGQPRTCISALKRCFRISSNGPRVDSYWAAERMKKGAAARWTSA